MTSSPVETLLTADDLLVMPEIGCQYELVRGKLITMRPSSSKPAIVAANVLGEVRDFVKKNRLGVCGGADWGFWLSRDPDTVRAPDCAFVQAARIPAGGVPVGFWPGAPDLAVEVLSPTNRMSEILAKVAEYLEAGTRLVWLIDPAARGVSVYHPSGLPDRIGEDGTLSGEDVLPGFSLDLAEIWV